MNTALLQGSEEGSGTAGTAAVNVAAGLERCFLRGGNAAAPLHFHYVHLNLGMDFKRLTYMTSQCVPKPLLVEVSTHRSPEDITLHNFFSCFPF